MSRPNRRPAQASANEAYRRALLLPVQPWKRQWIAPVGGSPGLKLMKWVKSDEKLQWSDDEDDGALEQALGAAAEHDRAGGEGEAEGEEGEEEEEEEGHERGEGNITPLDGDGGSSFPASGVQTPKEAERGPHPLRKEVKGAEEGEEGEEVEGEEGEEKEREGPDLEAEEMDMEMEMDVEPGAADADDEGREEGEEGEDDDADLHLPQAPASGEFGSEFGAPDEHSVGVDVGVDVDVDVDVDGGVGDPSGLIGDGFDGVGVGVEAFDHHHHHLAGLGEVAHKGLMEGEDVFDHEGAIEEALGQQPLGLVSTDTPEDPFA